MRVGFICRKNQIRSPFAAAVVSSIFPEIETFSAGTDPDSDSYVHLRAINLGPEWGIEVAKVHSTGIFEQRDFINSANLIVAAEDELLPKISVLPIGGKLTSFDKVALGSDFIPFDPIGTSELEFRVQMSKVAHIAIRCIHNQVYGPSIKSINAVVPISENIFDLALASAAFHANANGAILIYVDFRVYLTSIPWERTIIRYNPENFDVSFFLNKPKNSIFLPDREVTAPERLFLNRNWIDLIFRIAKFDDVILLTAPRYLDRGKIYDSYLATSFAETVTVINA